MYSIREDYTHRDTNSHHDDRAFEDGWQKEVYQDAWVHAALKTFTPTVLDYGCGSGFKLMADFKSFHTVGVEVEPALSYLRKKYPDRVWFAPHNVPVTTYNIIICADVIEHVKDPDFLLATLKGFMAVDSLLFLSTPDRDQLYSDGHLGPPNNPCHFREWTMKEFHNFVDSAGLDILKHVCTNLSQGTQLIVARKK